MGPEGWGRLGTTTGKAKKELGLHHQASGEQVQDSLNTLSQTSMAIIGKGQGPALLFIQQCIHQAWLLRWDAAGVGGDGEIAAFYCTIHTTCTYRFPEWPLWGMLKPSVIVANVTGHTHKYIHRVCSWGRRPWCLEICSAKYDSLRSDWFFLGFLFPAQIHTEALLNTMGRGLYSHPPDWVNFIQAALFIPINGAWTDMALELTNCCPPLSCCF